MCYVDVKQSNDSSKKHKDLIDDALRELKRRMKKEGILQDLKKHEFHLSVSQRKRFKKSEALKRRKRDIRKQQWFERNSKNST